MKNFLLTVLLAAGIGFSGVALADHDCGGGQCPMKSGMCDKDGSDGEKGGCPILNRILKKSCFFLSHQAEIGLSDEQVTKIKAIKLQAQKAQIQMGAGMQTMMLDLEAKLDEPKVDVEGITAMMEQGMGEMVKSGKTNVQWYADLKAVLTDEQMAKAKELWKKQ